MCPSVGLGMSLAENCKQINIVRRQVKDNMKREFKCVRLGLFLQGFSSYLELELGIDFAARYEGTWLHLSVRWQGSSDWA
jgi:hypothetical protein